MGIHWQRNEAAEFVGWYAYLRNDKGDLPIELHYGMCGDEREAGYYAAISPEGNFARPEQAGDCLWFADGFRFRADAKDEVERRGRMILEALAVEKK